MRYLATLLILLIPYISYSADILVDNFNTYNNMSDVSVNWGGAKTSITLTSDCPSGKCLQWSYTAGSDTGTTSHELRRSIPGDPTELYYQHKFRIVRNTKAEPRGSVKFVKFFGFIVNGNEYANSTFNLGDVSDTYPQLHGINYGSGGGLANDTDSEAFFTPGAHSAEDPLIDYTVQSAAFTPVEGQWYTIETYIKYNTNGNRDGEYRVWIDGVEKMHAINVKNRNDANVRDWNEISLGDYGSTYADMLLTIDDVVVSDSYIGAGATPDTTPPTVTASPDGNSSASITTVVLTANESATIYYTLDGSTPTTSSPTYSAPLSIKPGTTVKYFGKDTAGNDSTVQTSQYKWRQVCR